MDVKTFLRNKSIFDESYIYNIDDESFELSQLLTEYAESLRLIQPAVVGQSEQLVCDLCEGTGLNDRYTVQEYCHLCQGSGEAN
jgi:predicted methyltransferase